MLVWYLTGLLCFPLLCCSVLISSLAWAAQRARYWWKGLQLRAERTQLLPVTSIRLNRRHVEPSHTVTRTSTRKDGAIGPVYQLPR